MFLQMQLIATVRIPFIVEYKDSWVKKGSQRVKTKLLNGYCPMQISTIGRVVFLKEAILTLAMLDLKAAIHKYDVAT